MTIFGITGHQRIPSSGLEEITNSIRRQLLAAGSHLVGVGSLAAGADQLFAQILVDLGGKLVAIVPCRQYMESFSNEEDVQRYHKYLNQADSVEILDFTSPSKEAYLAAGKRVVDLSDELVAVWDGQPPRGVGGTADIVQYAHAQSRKIVIIWPDNLARE